MNFSEALERIKRGGRTRLPWWPAENGIAIRFPDEDSDMGHPYIYSFGDDRGDLPWSPTQYDLFADDWETVEA